MSSTRRVMQDADGAPKRKIASILDPTSDQARRSRLANALIRRCPLSRTSGEPLLPHRASKLTHRIAWMMLFVTLPILSGCPLFWSGMPECGTCYCERGLPFDEGADFEMPGSIPCSGVMDYLSDGARCISEFQLSIREYCADDSCLARVLPFSDECNAIIRGKYCEGARDLTRQDVDVLRSCVGQYVELASASAVSCESDPQFCGIFDRIEECVSVNGPQSLSHGVCFDVFRYIEHGGYMDSECLWWSSYECFKPYVGICHGDAC